eukprot:Nk52_evm12s349 gene=Nk52_evmTU12s349
MTSFSVRYSPIGSNSLGHYQNAIAYSTCTFAYAMMNSIFMLYYVELYLHVYGLDIEWFRFAHIIFMLWNAVNDPLFGWFQDTIPTTMNRRLFPIYYGGPIFVLSFLFPFLKIFPLENPTAVGLHFLFSLCFYDTMFTYVVISHCALFAEIATGEGQRQVVMRYSSTASILGCSVTFFSSYLWDRTDLTNFVYFLFAIAAMATCAMYYTATNCIVPDSSHKRNSDALENGVPEQHKSHKEQEAGVIDFLMGLFRNSNLIIFVTVNLLQTTISNIFQNFFILFQQSLLSAYSGGVVGSFSVLLASTLPQLTVICFSFRTSSTSYYLVRKLVYCRGLLAVGIALIGPQIQALLLIYILAVKTMSDVMGSFFNFSISDMIDEDMVRNKRRQPMSSMFFGFNALITKPGQSLGPIIVINYLSGFGYQVEGDHESASPSVDDEWIQNQSLKEAIFFVLWFTPLAVSVFQGILWTFYSLKDNYLKEIKHARGGPSQKLISLDEINISGMV